MAVSSKENEGRGYVVIKNEEGGGIIYSSSLLTFFLLVLRLILTNIINILWLCAGLKLEDARMCVPPSALSFCFLSSRLLLLLVSKKKEKNKKRAGGRGSR
jgi:hypothetical protein